MRFEDYLKEEWQPALGCTEPASIAYAAAQAGAQAGGEVRAVHLRCDPRMYRNCYAVGIPHSQHKVGIRWALAIGSLLRSPEAKLEVFRQCNRETIAAAGRLLEKNAVTVEVDPSARELLVDCRVVGTEGTGRAVIERDHVRLVRLERNGHPVACEGFAAEMACPEATGPAGTSVQEALAGLSPAELLQMAALITESDQAALRRGVELNLAIARHGLTLFPRPFMDLVGVETLTRISRLVCGGVYARMCGEDFLVMSLAGSGNKGIAVSLPLVLWGREIAAEDRLVDEALALACLVTSVATFHLGTLSAACGCSNAAGIGLAAGLVLLQGGGAREIELAVSNIVGNVTGMICDGAKIGCALKAMTAVDAAFRAASLAMSGIGIPETDGIVGADYREMLTNLGLVASQGMSAMDEQVLQIMQSKMRRGTQ